MSCTDKEPSPKIFFVTVRCEGDALVDPLGDVDRYELGRIMRHIANDLESGDRDGRPIHDMNGNRVGDWALAQRKEDR